MKSLLIVFALLTIQSCAINQKIVSPENQTQSLIGKWKLYKTVHVKADNIEPQITKHNSFLEFNKSRFKRINDKGLVTSSGIYEVMFNQITYFLTNKSHISLTYYIERNTLIETHHDKYDLAVTTSFYKYILP